MCTAVYVLSWMGVDMGRRVPHVCKRAVLCMGVFMCCMGERCMWIQMWGGVACVSLREEAGYSGIFGSELHSLLSDAPGKVYTGLWPLGDSWKNLCVPLLRSSSPAQSRYILMTQVFFSQLLWTLPPGQLIHHLLLSLKPSCLMP